MYMETVTDVFKHVQNQDLRYTGTLNSGTNKIKEHRNSSLKFQLTRLFGY